MNAAANARAPRWTEVQDDVAYHLWRDGERASAIAKAVGRTREAVIGRAFRQCWGAHPYGHDPRQA